MQTLKRDKLKQMLDAGESLFLIDVLSHEQFEKTHIPGSHNIPLADKDFVREVEQVVGDKGPKIVVYCSSFQCTASPKAAKKLDQAGFRQVLDFAGGIQDWQNAGYPVEGMKQ